MLTKLAQTRPTHLTLLTRAGSLAGWLVKLEDSSDGALAILVEDGRSIETPTVPTRLTVVPVSEVVAVTVNDAQESLVALSNGVLTRAPGVSPKGGAAARARRERAAKTFLASHGAFFVRGHLSFERGVL